MRGTCAAVLVATRAGVGAAPGAQDPTDPAAVKTRLAEVDKAVAAKEKELADLRAEADRLRKRLAATDDPPGKVCRTAKELPTGLPPEAYPKAGAGGRIERAKTEKWLKANTADRQIEWTAEVGSVSVCRLRHRRAMPQAAN